MNKKLIIIGIHLIVVLMFLGYLIGIEYFVGNEKIKIISKNEVFNKNSTKYLIVTDKGSFQLNPGIKNSFSAKDPMLMWNDIKEKYCYSISYFGKEVPILGFYRAIDTYKEIDCEKH